MELDEDALTGFFGAPPEAEGKEEQAFFGALTYRIVEGPCTLTAGFHTQFGDASLHVQMSGRDEPLLQSLLTNIEAVRAETNPAVLTLHARAQGAGGLDSALTVRATITLDPLALRFEDGMD